MTEKKCKRAKGKNEFLSHLSDKLKLTSKRERSSARKKDRRNIEMTDSSPILD